MVRDDYQNLTGFQKPQLRDDVKYRYALDHNNQIIEISSNLVIRGIDYVCLSCGKTLRPVKGKIRKNHFRHKAQVICSFESYLHNLAKLMFFQTYSDCLSEGRPFFFEYKAPHVCEACKSGPCTIGYMLQEIDLTRHFQGIFLETADESFVPDILLKGKDTKIYIEIVVTHFTTENKEQSGTRIIEVVVSDESDIDLISSCRISQQDPRVLTHNFQPSPIPQNDPEQCQKRLHCFVLYPLGNCDVSQISPYVFNQLSAKGIIAEEIDLDYRSEIDDKAFVEKIEKMFRQGKHIVNCWLCAFHCLHPRDGESSCKQNKLKIGRIKSNTAISCREYQPILTIPECGLMADAVNQKIKAQLEQPQNEDISTRVNSKIKGIRSFKASMALRFSQGNDAGTGQPTGRKTAKCVFCGVEFYEDSGGWWQFDTANGTCKCNACEKKGFW